MRYIHIAAGLHDFTISGIRYKTMLKEYSKKRPPNERSISTSICYDGGRDLDTPGAPGIRENRGPVWAPPPPFLSHSGDRNAGSSGSR